MFIRIGKANDEDTNIDAVRLVYVFRIHLVVWNDVEVIVFR